MNSNSQDLGKLSMVEAFGSAILKTGKKHGNLVLLHADSVADFELENFVKTFPDRHFNFAFGEQNMVSAAMGFSIRGKLPVLTGYANFLVAKGFEQIRNSICVPNLNVKIVSVGSGFSFSHDGVGYQFFEDLALMRALPNMKVLVPSDHYEAVQMVEAMMLDYGPTYLRLNSLGLVNIHSKGYKFKFGKMDVVREGDGEVVIFALGVMVSFALEAANFLKERGVNISVVNLCSVKPLDGDGVVQTLLKAKACFTIEDHSLNGGIGEAVAAVIAENALGVRLHRIGMDEVFGESGKAQDLYRKFGLDSHSLVEKILAKLA